MKKIVYIMTVAALFACSLLFVGCDTPESSDSNEPTEGLVYEISEGADYAVVKGYDGSDGSVTRFVIADEYQGKPVKVIDSGAFGNPDYTEFVIPDSVERIEYSAFNNSGYYNDQSNWENGLLYLGKHLIGAKPTVSGDLVIKDGTLSVAEQIFSGDENITSITFPGSLTYLPSVASGFIDKVETVTIKEGVKVIGANAFYWGKFKSITIPDSVTTIEKHAFSSSTVETVTFGSGLTSIGLGAFSPAHNLKSITIPGNVKTIEENAFYWTDELVEVKLEEGVESIGKNAFARGDRLERVEIPASVTTIGEDAFTQSTRYVDTVIYAKHEAKPDGWHENWMNAEVSPVIWNCTENEVATDGKIYVKDEGIRYALDPEKEIALVIKQTDRLTEANIKGSILHNNKSFRVTKIEDNAFSGSAELASLTIINNVTIIGERAFYNCPKLESVVIPGSVVEIGGSAFLECKGLTSVTLNEGLEKISKYAFKNTAITTLTIPASLKAIDEYCFITTTLTELKYNGSTSDWSNVEKEKLWWYTGGTLSELNCTDGKITFNQ